MQPNRPLWLLLALAASLAFPAARAQDASGDVAKLQGTWTLVAGSRDGKPISANDVGKSRIVWKGPKAEIQTPHQAAETIRVTVTFGTEGKHKTMEWVRENGPDAGKKMLAIYEIRGNDEYVVVFAPGSKDRPKEFDTKTGSGHIMHVWKRVKS